MVFIVKIARKDTEFVAGSMEEAKSYVRQYAREIVGIVEYSTFWIDYAEFVIHSIDGERREILAAGIIERQ